METHSEQIHMYMFVCVHIYIYYSVWDEVQMGSSRKQVIQAGVSHEPTRWQIGRIMKDLKN